MIGKLKFVLILFSVLFISGCYPSINKSYECEVEYYATYSSSAGNRILDINYTLVDDKIVKCSGTYTYPSSMEQRLEGYYGNNVENCSLDRLNSRNYNVPLKLVMEYPSRFQDEYVDGPSMYMYNVTCFS